MQLLPRLEMESDLLRHGDTPSLELRFRPEIRININTLTPRGRIILSDNFDFGKI